MLTRNINEYLSKLRQDREKSKRIKVTLASRKKYKPKGCDPNNSNGP